MKLSQAQKERIVAKVFAVLDADDFGRVVIEFNARARTVYVVKGGREQLVGPEVVETAGAEMSTLDADTQSRVG